MNIETLRNEMAGLDEQKAQLLSAFFHEHVPFNEGERVKLISNTGKAHRRLLCKDGLCLVFSHINKDGKVSETAREWSYDYKTIVSLDRNLTFDVATGNYEIGEEGSI